MHRKTGKIWFYGSQTCADKQAEREMLSTIYSAPLLGYSNK